MPVSPLSENLAMDSRDAFHEEKKQWPTIFPVPTDTFPTSLKQALEKKVPLNQKMKKIIIHCLYEALKSFNL